MRSPRAVFLLRPLGVVFLLFLAGACGAAAAHGLPDESRDSRVGSAAQRDISGTRPVDARVSGSEWTWVEASCTEGPLDLASRGFRSRLRVKADDRGLLLAYDHQLGDACAQTVMQRAMPGRGRDAAWAISEVARIAEPATPACSGRPEEDRPGDVRMRGEFLEVSVQRSQWCNGLEVKMIWAPAAPLPLTDAEVVRHYLAHFERRDAVAVAGLFAESGSLVEPFDLTPEGGPTRLEGRDAVEGWYAEAFGNTPWLALSVESLEPGAVEGQRIAEFQYMDPRLEQPFRARNTFTLAGGEIFEAQFTITASEADSTSAE